MYTINTDINVKSLCTYKVKIIELKLDWQQFVVQ